MPAANGVATGAVICHKLNGESLAAAQVPPAIRVAVVKPCSIRPPHRS
jgi:hypothetical protein